MAWQGTAHAGLNLSATMVYVLVKQFGQAIVEHHREIDINLIAAQVKRDILDDLTQPIPQGMRNNVAECILVLCVSGNKIVLNDYDRLIKYVDDLVSGNQVRLELHEPGANIENDNPPNLAQFGVHLNNQS